MLGNTVVAQLPVADFPQAAGGGGATNFVSQWGQPEEKAPRLRGIDKSQIWEVAGPIPVAKGEFLANFLPQWDSQPKERNECVRATPRTRALDEEWVVYQPMRGEFLPFFVGEWIGDEEERNPRKRPTPTIETQDEEWITYAPMRGEFLTAYPSQWLPLDYDRVRPTPRIREEDEGKGSVAPPPPPPVPTPTVFWELFGEANPRVRATPRTREEDEARWSIIIPSGEFLPTFLPEWDDRDAKEPPLARATPKVRQLDEEWRFPGPAFDEFPIPRLAHWGADQFERNPLRIDGRKQAQDELRSVVPGPSEFLISFSQWQNELASPTRRKVPRTGDLEPESRGTFTQPAPGIDWQPEQPPQVRVARKSVDEAQWLTSIGTPAELQPIFVAQWLGDLPGANIRLAANPRVRAQDEPQQPIGFTSPEFLRAIVSQWLGDDPAPRLAKRLTQDDPALVALQPIRALLAEARDEFLSRARKAAQAEVAQPPPPLVPLAALLQLDDVPTPLRRRRPAQDDVTLLRPLAIPAGLVALDELPGLLRRRTRQGDDERAQQPPASVLVVLTDADANRVRLRPVRVDLEEARAPGGARIQLWVPETGELVTIRHRLSLPDGAIERALTYPPIAFTPAYLNPDVAEIIFRTRTGTGNGRPVDQSVVEIELRMPPFIPVISFNPLRRYQRNGLVRHYRFDALLRRPEEA